ncbi:helix-turn-helix domain-containing protein [Corynebacterium sp. KPL2850]|uniref:helix-turn-helix domain-containing protein n=1 Tax=Corynebacterium sp. KPL2850 TaxID=3158318 RepID=UPI0032EB5395
MRQLSYKKLWPLPTDKNLTRNQLREQTVISASTMTRLALGADVTTDVLIKSCDQLDVPIHDICKLAPVDHGESEA